MPMFQPFIPSPAVAHAEEAWAKDECYHFYVRQRRQHCKPRELMDLWLRAPCCQECIESDPLIKARTRDCWWGRVGVDMLLALGPETVTAVERDRAADAAFAFRCKKCLAELKPWDGDDVHVLHYHLEEHYGIPMETPGRSSVSRALRRKVIQLYGRACFGCGATDRRLHIDHVKPRSEGGDAAFRNLQPLCTPCGQAKGHAPPAELLVYSDIYFGPQPSDGYEGLFW